MLLSYWKNSKETFQPLDSNVRYCISRRNTHLAVEDGEDPSRRFSGTCSCCVPFTTPYIYSSDRTIPACSSHRVWRRKVLSPMSDLLDFLTSRAFEREERSYERGARASETRPENQTNDFEKVYRSTST